MLVIIYLVGGIALYFFQDKILFHPKPLAKNHKFLFTQPSEELNILLEKENVSIVKFKPTGIRKGIALFTTATCKMLNTINNTRKFFSGTIMNYG